MNYSLKQIMTALFGSMLTAGVVLLVFVLPAEFGLDPLGSGKLFGLTGLAGQTQQIVHEEQGSFVTNSVTFELAPYESVEYKFELDGNSSLNYSWEASGELAFEFHGEPDGGPEGFAETYQVGKATNGAGTATLPFTGKHGWYFANRHFEDATVTLRSSGFYRRIYTFRDGFVDVREPSNN